MVNEFFERVRIKVAEDLSEVSFLRFGQVGRIHESLIWSLRDFFILSDIAGSDFLFR